jgi:hypothetical protein
MHLNMAVYFILAIGFGVNLGVGLMALIAAQREDSVGAGGGESS